MLFCVFSFNRGRFLENCVASIELCVPGARIAIFDDNSYDEETVSILTALSLRYPVISAGGMQSRKLGGLYGNMQAALEYAEEQALVCFLQDDMQMVRPVSEQELGALRDLLVSREDLGFLQPCFLKGSNRTRDEVSLAYDPDAKCYFRKGGSQSAGLYFSAVSVIHPKKLLEKGWQFERTEPMNDIQARRYFGKIGHLSMPFAMYLPDVPAYRGKVKTLALRIAEKRRRVGFYPFRIMDEADIGVLFSRAPQVLPVAEDFLHCVNGDPTKPWAYYPLKGSGLLKKMNLAELALRRWFQRD
jgi:hypothetical protein